MPYSAGENRDDIRKFVLDHHIATVLDVGAGSGTYNELIGDLVDQMDAVEIWQPYIPEFGLLQKYDKVIEADVRNLKMNDFSYDLVIFGDVLEHMTREDSMRVWGTAGAVANYGMISVPIIHYPQGEAFGNPYEKHVQEHMHVDEIVRDYGPFVFQKEYNVTGMFIKEF